MKQSPTSLLIKRLPAAALLVLAVLCLPAVAEASTAGVSLGGTLTLPYFCA